MQVDYKHIALDTLVDIARDQDSIPQSVETKQLKEPMGVGEILYSCLRKSNSGLDLDIIALSKLRYISDQRFYEIFEKARKYEQGE